MKRLVLVLVLVLAACEKSQSAHDGMQALCNAQVTNAAPSEREAMLAKWVDKQVRNAEIRDLYASLRSLTPTDRRARLAEAARKHGITDCELAREQLSDKLPDVTGPGVEPVEEGGPVIVVTPSAIVIDGKSIVTVHDGEIDPAEKEGGALGMMVPRISNFVASLPNRDRRVLIAMDRTLPFHLFYEVIFSAKHPGVKSFGLLANKQGTQVMVPITLPEKKPMAVAADRASPNEDEDDGGVIIVARAGEPPPPNALRMMLSVFGDKLVVWSVSGLEGTLEAPKLARPIAGAGPELQQVLGEIVARRYPGPRRPSQRQIVAMYDGKMSMQIVLETLANVRRTEQGKELFPDVLLSAGFE